MPHRLPKRWLCLASRDMANAEIADGQSTKMKALARRIVRKLLRYIRKYNEQPRPVKWKYFDPTRRATPDSIVTAH